VGLDAEVPGGEERKQHEGAGGLPSLAGGAGAPLTEITRTSIGETKRGGPAGGFLGRVYRARALAVRPDTPDTKVVHLPDQCRSTRLLDLPAANSDEARSGRGSAPNELYRHLTGHSRRPGPPAAKP
jgi:hypothetical protein